MKNINELDFGYSDAEHYKRRENKEFFNKIFIKDNHLDKLCQPNISFLIGEKGTGKTAYSVYLSNNNYKKNSASIKFIRETDYATFIKLKEEKHLSLSDYNSIWKVILLLLMSHHVKEHEFHNIFEKIFNYNKFSIINEAIDEYYYGAFAPEISQAINFAESSKISAELLSKLAVLKGEENNQKTFTENRFQNNLFYIRKKFEEGLSQLNLKQNHIMFIDGIDLRPSNTSHSDYLECIKGLGSAIWELNNDFFPSIKGSKGRLRIVMLVRPDIFNRLGLHNQNTKFRDSSVYLDWQTTFENYRNSMLFEIADNLLSKQQVSSKEPGDTWNHYFNWHASNTKIMSDNPTSFIDFLRISYYRPRDISTILSILKENFSYDTDKKNFTFNDLDSPLFKREYSTYLLGEIKDQISFYYSTEEYELFLEFFKYLNGSNKFNYDTYLIAYRKLIKHIADKNLSIPKSLSTADDFLQLLFELNVLGYIETTNVNQKLFHWSYKNRSYSNISPKVKTHTEYVIFYGLAKALKIGQSLI